MKQTPAIPTSTPSAASPAWRAWHAAVATAALAAFALLAAGCGTSNPPSGGVAHLGSRTASSTTSSTAAAQSGGAGSGPAQALSQGVAYGACVRAHGVPSFPDPKVSTHGSEVRVAIAINPAISGNPHFKSAQQACRKLLPGGGPGSRSAPHLSAAEQTQVLKLAACIRAHGVPNLPDPTFSGGGVHLPPAVNVHSSVFKSAEQACQSLIPNSLRGGASGG